MKRAAISEKKRRREMAAYGGIGAAAKA